MQNLFDKASLVMVPSGYDNGKLYNIKPEDKGSAFEFERGGTAATQINSERKMVFSGVTEDELITNGSFDTDFSGWVAYSNTLLSHDSNGYVVLNNDNNFWCKIQQANVFEVGKTYEVTVRAKSNRVGTNLHGSPVLGSFVENDKFQTFKQYYQATSTGFNFGFANVASFGTVTITIDYVSVKEINLDTPRIDYTKGEGVLLLEPQRTNEFIYSERETQWSGIAALNLNVSLGQGFGDFETSTKLTSTPMTNSRLIRNLQYPAVLNEENVISLRIKKKEGWYMYFRAANGGGSSGAFWVNISENGGFVEGTGAGENTNPYVVEFDDYYLCALKITCNGTTSAGLCEIHFNKQPDVSNWSNSTNEEFFISGLQREVGVKYPTSYIPTRGSIATRAADVCDGGGSADVFNNDEGVLFAEVKFDNQNNYEIISINDGSSSNSVNIGKSNNGADDAFYIRAIGGGTFAGINGVISGFSSLENNKIAIMYGSVGKIYINGSDVTAGMNTMPTITGLTELQFEQAGGSRVYGNVKALHYFSEALTDEELQRLTSPSADATTFTELANNNGYTIL